MNRLELRCKALLFDLDGVLVDSRGVAAGRAAGARVLGLTTTFSALDLPETEATIPDFTRTRVRPGQDVLVLTVQF